MSASEERGRKPSFAARRRHYQLRLKRQLQRFSISALRSALLRPANREDVIECYRAILGREPEDDRVVDGHLSTGPLLRDIIFDFSHSGELRAKHLRSNVALDRAREPDYLARSLHGIQRVQAYFGHYGYLTEAMATPALNTIIASRATLYSLQSRRADYRVLVTATHGRHEEGELQLQLHREDTILYVLGVTIVPGDVLGMEQPHVWLVSRMQGAPGVFAEIREATKDFGDVHPKAVLFSALQGFARAVGVTWIAGVSARNQIAFRDDRSETFEKAYDDFFASMGAEPRDANFFVFDCTRERPAPVAASRSHVKRAERKRRLQAEIIAGAESEARNWTKGRRAPQAAPIACESGAALPESAAAAAGRKGATGASLLAEPVSS
jgi:uncharacterized protein VirK/YbjX